MEGLQAPFPYFGGKSRVALEVWRRFGDPENYIEPFCGSCAVLLARPSEPKIETVNDMDGLLTNFWRAVRAEPDAVADLMNWPVNEIDLEARHKWLCRQPEFDGFVEAMKNDPDLYDVKRAAWWCWGICQWIGGGWCAGKGVHGKRPHLGTGKGVHRQRPHLGAGRGVHRQLPHLGNAGIGENERRGEALRMWMKKISDRLRNVRICCGDWKRTCGSYTTTTLHGTCGVFLDPPYSKEAKRCDSLYRCEDLDVAHDVREWAIERGRDPMMRIALCGYEGEHRMPDDWKCVHWKAHGGYARSNDALANRFRERIWFSPHCIEIGDLFSQKTTER